jgi:hypothetical protein
MVCRRIIAAMTKAREDNPKPSQSGTRAGRLAAALRENLRRRKAQARGRNPEPPRPDAGRAEKDGKGG